MTAASIIGAIVIGAILGLLGRLFAPGKQNISLVVTVIVGIIAALLGSAIARGLGVADTDGIDFVEVLIQIALAAIGVIAAARLLGRRAH